MSEQDIRGTAWDSLAVIDKDGKIFNVANSLLEIALALNRIADALEAENKLTAAAKADQ
jgi:hypothetical protein